MTASLRTLVLPAIAIAIGACASAPSPTAPPVPTSGTSIRVLDEGGGVQTRIDTLEIVVDGVSQYRSAPRGSTPLPVATLALTPGVHSMAVRAHLRASAAFPDPAWVTIHERFSVDEKGSLVDVDLHLSPAEGRPGRGLDVRFRMAGAKPVSGSLPEVQPDLPDLPASVAPLDVTAADAQVGRIEVAQGKVSERVANARAARDIISLQCQNDKLTQIIAQLRVARERRDALVHDLGAGDHASVQHDSAILGELRERAEALVAESDECAREDAAVAPKGTSGSAE